MKEWALWDGLPDKDTCHTNLTPWVQYPEPTKEWKENMSPQNGLQTSTISPGHANSLPTGHHIVYTDTKIIKKDEIMLHLPLFKLLGRSSSAYTCFSGIRFRLESVSLACCLPGLLVTSPAFYLAGGIPRNVLTSFITWAKSYHSSIAYWHCSISLGNSSIAGR